MRNLLAIAVLIALIVLVAMSLAPAEWVGVRSGYGSLAGVVTALGLLAITVAGGWIWLRDKGRKND